MSTVAARRGGSVRHSPRRRMRPSVALGFRLHFAPTTLSIIYPSDFQVGVYYPYNRGALLASCVFLYAITAGTASNHRFAPCC
jgi:hypothetical protein